MLAACKLTGRRVVRWMATIGLALAVLPGAARAQDSKQGQPTVSELELSVTQLRRGTAADDPARAALSPEQESDLVRRIVSQPRESWMVWVDALAGSPPGSRDRQVAVRLLGAGGRASDLARLAKLAEGEEADGLLPRAFAQTFELAVAELLARAPGSVPELRRTTLETSIGVRRSLVTALAAKGGSRVLEDLTALLRYDAELDPTLLTLVARVARGAGKPVDPAVVQQVRRCIVDEDAQVVTAAAAALGSLEDLDSVDVLAALLDHPVACVRGDAHRALKRVAGVSLPATRTRWEHWIAEERAWYAERAPELIERLGSSNRFSLVQSLGEIGMHRLHRRALARAVAVLLGRTCEDVRALACQTLAQLGSPEALTVLVAALEDKDANVRSAAWSALKTITQEGRPAEAAAWAGILAGESLR
jgi:HEAT repeat protein